MALIEPKNGFGWCFQRASASARLFLLFYALIPDEHISQFVHLRFFELWSHECSLIDLGEPPSQYLPGLVLVCGVRAFTERPSVAVVLDPHIAEFSRL